VSFEELLNVFWKAHDPTQVNRQGPDFGAQYRTAIFFHSPEQEAAAKKSMASVAASGKFKRPIATEITAAGPFYRAEEYHQKYLQKRGAPSCHF
jgi:peptide-methionine (S)-S-oxide reductase